MDKMPVFVKVEEYENVLSLVKTIHKKLDEAKETLQKVNELKNEEDHQLEIWHNTLGEVEKNIDFITNSLNEPQKF